VINGVQGYPSTSAPFLVGFGWGVQGIDDLWTTMLENGIYSLDQRGTPWRQSEPPIASFSTMKLFYTDAESTGLRYEFLPTEGIAPADVRGDPNWTLPPVSKDDPLGIVRCSHHTVLTNQPLRAFNLMVKTLGGTVVNESRNEILKTKSVYVELAGDLFEYAEPLEEGTPAMDNWRERAPLDSYHALTWQVVDLDRVARHLEKCNVRLRTRTEETIITEPHDALGIPWGFTTSIHPWGNQ
jgi:hypothetical protein